MATEKNTSKVVPISAKLAPDGAAGDNVAPQKRRSAEAKWGRTVLDRGFVMVPAMLYLLGMAAGVVVGTSLFQILFVTAVATLLHATQSQTVDILLAVLLLLGGVVGAQLGARAAQRLPAEKLRLFLALLVLAVAIRLAIGLTWTPRELFSIQTALA